MKTPAESHELARHMSELEKLREELGLVGMIQHLQQNRPGTGNYTEERHAWINEVTLDDILARTNEIRRERGEKELVWPPRGDPPV